MSYTWLLGVGPPACDAGSAKPLATVGLLSVAGKGPINVALADGARCLPFEYGPPPGRFDWLCEPQEFSFHVVPGPFGGASGKGKVGRCGARLPGGPGEWKETWTGTLDVPGFKFDQTPPRLRGAVSKTFRAGNGAKTRRVVLGVTATDGVDGAVPVSCRPGSGSRFKIGKTRVDCSATDSSGNTAKKAFTVTVRR